MMMPIVRLGRLPVCHVEWLWPGHLPLGHVVMLDADPKTGKSLVTLDLCARVTTARPFPDGSPGPVASNVIVINAEDHARTTIRGRLVAAGADLDRCFVWERSGDEQWLSLPKHLDRLDESLTETKAKLVIIDPITAFLPPGINVCSDADVRRVLAPLADRAQKYNCVIILVRHLSKQTSGRALYRGLHSIGFIAASRVGYFAAQDPKMPGRRVLAQCANNFAPLAPSLTYSITRHESGEAGLEWHGVTSWSADDLVQNYGPRARQLARAREFLVSFLKDGPRLVKETRRTAAMADISYSTLKRALKDLGGRHECVTAGRYHATF